MKRGKYLLDQKDREILRKCQINKEVQIKLVKLHANVNTKQGQNDPLILSCNFNVSSNDFESTDDVSYLKKEKERFKCQLCEYSSALNRRLKQHLWTHSVHKQFKCDKCSFKTNQKRNLQYHTDSQHNKNPESRQRNYACQLCSKCFFTIYALRVHVSVHTKEKPFSCHFCGKSVATNGEKNRHETVCIQNPKRSDPIWVESQKRFQCKLCGRKLSAKHDLTAHVRRHTQERPYKCDQCDYAAAIASALKLHVERRHNSNKIKSFACEFCLKLFFTKEELYSHIQTHTKETSIACEFCKKQFSQFGNRNRHQIICKSNPKQSDEEWVRKRKKFKCELCNYASTEKSSLKKHLKIYGRTKNLNVVTSR